MANQQPLYNFYCVICGTQFSPARSHATTCKMECRVIRAALTKKWVEQIPESEREPINKEEVKDGYKKATGGREIPNAALAQHADKPDEEPESIAGRFTRGSARRNPPPAPAASDSATPEAPAESSQEEVVPEKVKSRKKTR